jgi:hypothetical protein
MKEKIQRIFTKEYRANIWPDLFFSLKCSKVRNLHSLEETNTGLSFRKKFVLLLQKELNSSSNSFDLQIEFSFKFFQSSNLKLWLKRKFLLSTVISIFFVTFHFFSSKVDAAVIYLICTLRTFSSMAEWV